MALNIKKLNADTTFLLTFSPPFAPDPSAKRVKFPGDFTVLLDPWLAGQSSILHPTFQVSHHTVEPAITSLADIKQHIDLIVISQDKPDHCHRETLCSLGKDKQVDILATPAAAKKIRSWKFFDARRVHALSPYKAEDDATLVKIGLPAYSSGKAGGQIVIANVAPKRDMTGLHNAIGITYQPPDTVFTLNSQWERYDQGTTIRLSSAGFTEPSVTPRRPRTNSGGVPTADKKTLRKSVSYPYLPTQSSDSTSPEPARPRTRADSGTARLPTPTNHEPVLSVLYSPHGIPTSALTPYIDTHLRPAGALPILALLHSMTTEQNPWFMGGIVANGAPGGIEIVRATGARTWVGAHDEVKDNRGLATAFIRSTRYKVEEVRKMLESEDLGGNKQNGRKVFILGVGESARLKPNEEEENTYG